jgi:hypothetical protein
VIAQDNGLTARKGDVSPTTLPLPRESPFAVECHGGRLGRQDWRTASVAGDSIRPFILAVPTDEALQAVSHKVAVRPISGLRGRGALVEVLGSESESFFERRVLTRLSPGPSRLDAAEKTYLWPFYEVDLLASLGCTGRFEKLSLSQPAKKRPVANAS